MLTIMIALIPALLWGCMPIVITKIGGTTRQQTMGITMGALLFALIALGFTTPSFSVGTLVIGFFNRVFLGCGTVISTAVI